MNLTGYMRRLLAGRSLAPLLALGVAALACGRTVPVDQNGLAPGDHEFTLEHGGRERSYIVHVPPTADAPLPVVLNFHGGASHASQQQAYTGMDALADEAGFLAVYPNGTGRGGARLLTWNAGSCCGYAQEEQVDDVGFVLALLDDLAARIAIDSARVYATGISNGAMMSYRLAVEASDRIAAIAPIAGSMVVETFAPTRPMPVMHIHSVDDPRALYAGGAGPANPVTGVQIVHPDAEAQLARWAAFNQCPTDPTVTARAAANGHTAVRIEYAPCSAGVEVVLWKLTGAGHVWPGSARDAPEALLGAPTQVIDANKEMWAFFSRFSNTAP